ncbi:MAG TPA: DUF2278 family protein [Pyrinomonadaceae bacterium]|jgi:uncharacterized protein YukJ
MPLPAYGVLIGTLNHFARDDQNNFGSWYHGKIYLDTPNGQYECAVDVSTPSGIKVQYREIHDLDRTLFAPILALSNGWHLLARTSTSGAIDYIRSPLFRIRIGCLPIVANALINFLIRLLEALLSRWIESTGDNALNVLETQLNGCTRVFVFGAPYNRGLGVHDIHMNQGDPPGQFQHLDAIWQDGGTIIERPDGELVAVLTKFETQSLHTDNNGLPI